METFFGINGIFQTPPSGLDPNKNQGRGSQRSLARSGEPGRFRTSHPPNRNAGQCCRPLVSRPVAANSWFRRSEEHTSELQSLMRISYAVFCLKNKTVTKHNEKTYTHMKPHPLP